MKTVFGAIVFLTAIYAVAEAQQPPANGKKPSPFQQAIDDLEEARKSSAATVPQQEPRKLSKTEEAFKTLTGMTPEEYDAAQSYKRCFDVVMPPRGGQSSIASAGESILLNRCTGDTWVLVRSSVGKTGNNFVYRWYPIKTGSDEAVIGP